MQRAAALEEDEALAVAHNDMAMRGDTNVAGANSPPPQGPISTIKNSAANTKQKPAGSPNRGWACCSASLS